MNGRQLASRLAGAGSVFEIAVSPASADGSRTLAAALGKGKFALLDVTDPQTPRRLGLHEGSTRGSENTVAFNPAHPEMLAAAGADGVIQLWDLGRRDAPRLLDSRKTGGSVNDLAFAPDGTVLLSAGNGGKLEWRVGNSGFSAGGPTSLSPTDSSTDGVAVAPNGSYAFAVYGGASGLGIELHDAVRDRDLFLPATDYVTALAFTDHGSTLVSAGFDSTVTTWDVATGRLFGPARSHGFDWTIWDVAVSDDGATVASAGADGNVKLGPSSPRTPWRRRSAGSPRARRRGTTCLRSWGLRSARTADPEPRTRSPLPRPRRASSSGAWTALSAESARPSRRRYPSRATARATGLPTATTFSLHPGGLRSACGTQVRRVNGCPRARVQSGARMTLGLTPSGFPRLPLAAPRMATCSRQATSMAT